MIFENKEVESIDRREIRCSLCPPGEKKPFDPHGPYGIGAVKTPARELITEYPASAPSQFNFPLRPIMENRTPRPGRPRRAIRHEARALTDRTRAERKRRRKLAEWLAAAAAAESHQRLLILLVSITRAGCIRARDRPAAAGRGPGRRLRELGPNGPPETHPHNY